MNDSLTFEGKAYISSKRASQLTGYAQDYVGQLARGGKVPAKLVGRSWYVEEEAITHYDKAEEGKAVVRMVPQVGYTPHYSPFAAARQRPAYIAPKVPVSVAVAPKVEVTTPKIEVAPIPKRIETMEGNKIELKKVPAMSAISSEVFPKEIKSGLSSEEKLKRIANIGTILEEGPIESTVSVIEKKQKKIKKEGGPSILSLTFPKAVVAGGLLAVGVSSMLLNHSVSYLAGGEGEVRTASASEIGFVSLSEIGDGFWNLVGLP